MSTEQKPQNYIGWCVPPMLIDRADGVKGHYSIGRSKDGRTYEYWDASRDLWCAFGTVFDYETANGLLLKLRRTIKTTALPPVFHNEETAGRQFWCKIEYVWIDDPIIENEP